MPNFNAIYALLMREARVFLRETERIVSILISPLLFLFVMGRGMVSGNSPVPGYTYQQFIFPGIMAMVILFTSITMVFHHLGQASGFPERSPGRLSRTTLFSASLSAECWAL